MNLEKHDIVRTTTRPFIYAVVSDPHYAPELVEVAGILKRHALAGKVYKADGYSTSHRDNLIKITLSGDALKLQNSFKELNNE